MSKRRKPVTDRHVVEETANMMSEPAQLSAPPVEREDPRRQSLADIRSNALSAQADIARTIGELEEWRAEIEMTLAYLRAMRK